MNFNYLLYNNDDVIPRAIYLFRVVGELTATDLGSTTTSVGYQEY